MDALQWLQRKSDRQFDVVFVDPPYAAGLYAQCCALLRGGNWLAPGALIYIEAEQSLEELELPASWQLIRHKRAGGVHYGLCQQA
jgi:16S rRNA (guanine966-N2)-methyltransferase